MTARSKVTTLFVPGLREHVRQHWQTYMAGWIPGSVTVEPPAGNRLSRDAQMTALDAALNRIEGDIVLVAHSAGVLTVAFWDLIDGRPIRAALLVTPPDLEKPLPENYPSIEELDANGWRPVPRARLTFPATLVASRNDPLSSYAAAAELARDWGARLHDAGEVGHLNPASGYGPWPEGLALWEEMMRSLD